MASRFDKDKATETELRLLKETIGINTLEEEHKQPVNTHDSQIQLVNDLHSDDISNL